MANLYNINMNYLPLIWKGPLTFSYVADDSTIDYPIELSQTWEISDISHTTPIDRSLSVNLTAARLKQYCLSYLNHDMAQFNTLMGDLQRLTAINWNAYFTTPYQITCSSVLLLESALRTITKEYRCSLLHMSPGSDDLSALMAESVLCTTPPPMFNLDEDDGSAPQ